MNLYALRDRLIDYFMRPFTAPSDQEVMQSIAQVINSGDTSNAVTQAPHHFEIWKLAEIDEQGYVKGEGRCLVCDCSSLVREGVRTSRTDRETSAQDAPRGPIGGQPGQGSHPSGTRRTTPSDPQEPLQRQTVEGETTTSRNPGGPRHVIG